MAWPGTGLLFSVADASCMSRMLVVRHPINSFDAYWDYPRTALSGLYRCPEFDWMSVGSKTRAGRKRMVDGRTDITDRFIVPAITVGSAVRLLA